MDKATTKQLDALADGSEISVVMVHDFYTVAVFDHCVFRQRTPPPLGLAWKVEARTTKKVFMFILPDFDATFVTHEGERCPRLRVTITKKKTASRMLSAFDSQRVRAAAAEAGAENFSQADLDEFMETVKRLEQRGVITLPKARKAVRG